MQIQNQSLPKYVSKTKQLSNKTKKYQGQNKHIPWFPLILMVAFVFSGFQMVITIPWVFYFSSLFAILGFCASAKLKLLCTVSFFILHIYY